MLENNKRFELIENEVFTLISWLNEEAELSFSNWTEKLKTSFTKEKIENIKSELKKFGQIKNVGDINEYESLNYTVKIVFELAEFFINLRFNSDNQLKGLFILPNNSKLFNDIELSPEFNEIAKEIKVKIGEDKRLLVDGSILMPLNRVSAMVVFVQGSGALDKNENIGNCAPFFDIAVNLAKNNIASIRFDKRTWTYPFLNMKDPEEEIINDAVIAANLAYDELAKKDIPLILVGHSQGALFLTKIAEKLKYKVKGLILLAPPSDNDIHNKLIDQLNYFIGQNPEKKEIYLKKIKDIVTAKKNWEKYKKNNLNNSEFDESLIFNKAIDYLKYLESYEPIVEVKKMKIPILVLQGEKDYNVLASKDFLKWKSYVLKSKNNKNSFKLYPNLNHFFYNHDDDRYFNNVELIIINDIIEWIGII